MDYLSKCNLCPRNCNINRYKEIGFCGLNETVKVARCDLYYYEEPSISGTNGSGTIFFSNCNLKCVYCQNYDISTKQKGKEITIEHLADIFIDLQNKKAHNINLVTPTMYIPQIKKALILAKEKGLVIPIVYNSSGYENINSLKLLDGLIDIYMPDFKYINNNYATKYSKCPNYVESVKEALAEMYRQVGKNKFNKYGIMTKGVLVRHLVLPNLTNESKKIIKYLYNKYGNNIYISIMNQYTPLKQVEKYLEINRTITNEEYEDVINYAISLGIENCYIQEGETCKESFIPDFDYTGI